MNTKYALIAAMLLIVASLDAQQPVQSTKTQAAAAKPIPHQFKEIKIGATLEAVREHNDVRLYILVDDIEQYDEISIERGDGQNNFGQCKLIKVEKGKYPNNYIEVVDQYPLSPKMSNIYRIKTVTSEGIMRMYPSVTITYPELKAEN